MVEYVSSKSSHYVPTQEIPFNTERNSQQAHRADLNLQLNGYNW